MPVVQVRNAEMQELNQADLLSADDKNVAAEFYDSVGGQTFIFGQAPLVVNLDTTGLNIAPTVFLLEDDILTVMEAGLYMFNYQVSARLNGGSANAVNGVWLEEDPDTGVWATVPTTAVYASPAALNTSIATATGSIIKLVGIDYRYRLRLEQSNGSTPMITVANASKLSVMRLFKNG